jgi:hypothetical protein
MSTDIYTEKRKTSDNSKNEVITAKIIANYGDPGLDEDYQFDILSRFVIVALESTDRIPTIDKWSGILAVVMRPTNLWINVVGQQQANPTDQQRSDNEGNTNTGLSSNYAINTISRINQPYQVGEIINIKKLSQPLQLNNQQQNSIFQSMFNTFPINQQYYNSWYNAGAFLPYIQQNNAQQALTQKTIALASNTGGTTYYYPTLNKYQYEAFVLLQNISNAATTQTLTQIFNGSWNGTSQVYNANGGYLFNNTENVSFTSVNYVDLNNGQLGNKQRDSSDSCIPLVVVTPQTFPVPKVRSTSTFSYAPTVLVGG